MRLIPMIAASALALGIAMPASVANAQEVFTTADVNLREGPGTRFDVIRSIPDDRRLDAVYGCLENLDWCEVQYRGQRGWVFADYLEIARDGRRAGAIGRVGPGMGLPTVAFGDDVRMQQRHDGVQPQSDQRFVPNLEVQGSVGLGSGQPDEWRQQQRRDGVQPQADPRFENLDQTGAIGAGSAVPDEWRRQQREDGVQPQADPRF